MVTILPSLIAGRHWRVASEKRATGRHKPSSQAAPAFRQLANQAVRRLCRHFSLAGCQGQAVIGTSSRGSAAPVGESANLIL